MREETCATLTHRQHSHILLFRPPSRVWGIRAAEACGVTWVSAASTEQRAKEGRNMQLESIAQLGGLKSKDAQSCHPFDQGR